MGKGHLSRGDECPLSETPDLCHLRTLLVTVSGHADNPSLFAQQPR